MSCRKGDARHPVATESAEAADGEATTSGIARGTNAISITAVASGTTGRIAAEMNTAADPVATAVVVKIVVAAATIAAVVVVAVNLRAVGHLARAARNADARSRCGTRSARRKMRHQRKMRHRLKITHLLPARSASIRHARRSSMLQLAPTVLGSTSRCVENGQCDAKWLPSTFRVRQM